MRDAAVGASLLIAFLDAVVMVLGCGLGILARAEGRARTIALCGAYCAALLLWLYCGALSSRFVAALAAVPLGLVMLGIGGAALFAVLIGLQGLSRWPPIGIVLGLAVFALLLPSDVILGHRPGVLAVPPLLAGLALGTARAGRRLSQGAAIGIWSLAILFPLSLIFLGLLERGDVVFGWSDAARIFTRHLPASIGLIGRSVSSATALYWLLSLSTLALLWLPLHAWFLRREP